MPAEHHAEAMIRKPRRIEISPLGISITNLADPTEGFAYLYLSDDPKLGKFELTIKAIGKTLGLAGNSVLDLYIPTDMQTPKQLERVRLTGESAASWQLGPIKDGLRLTLLSGKSLKVTEALPVTIGLEGMLATGEVEIKRDLTFSWKGFEGVDDDYRLFALRSILPRKVFANIECAWRPREEYYEDGGAFVYYTPYEPTTQLPSIENRLLLLIENKGEALVGERAEFTVTFPTEAHGDTRSALCFNEQLKKVKCTRYGPGRAWRVSRIEDAEVTLWKIQPPQGEKLVLAAKETVTFEFTNLITELKGGEARAQVYWSGLEKLSSGYASRFILKREPAPYLRELYVCDASGRKLGLDEGLYCGEAYKLCWDTFAIDRCEIESTPGGKFSARSFFEFKADRETKEFNVTPQILNRNGLSRRYIGRLRPAEAVLRQKPVKVDGLDCVQLEWETRGGVASLGSIRTPRSSRQPTGTEIVRSNDVYTLQVDTLGKITEQRLGVSVPHCFVETWVDWEAPGPERFVTLNWRGSNATNCELFLVMATSLEVQKHFVPVSSTSASSASWRFDANKTAVVMLQLWGDHGTCIWHWFTYSPEKRAPLPIITFREAVEPQTGKLRVTWSTGSHAAYFQCNDGDSQHIERDRTSMDFMRDFVSPNTFYSINITYQSMGDPMSYIGLDLAVSVHQPMSLTGKSPGELMQQLQRRKAPLSTSQEPHP